jgi:hypothetical protein
MILRLYFFARSNIFVISQGCPYKWTGIIALVLIEIFFSIRSAFIVKNLSVSTKTGLAPERITTLAVAANVNEGTILVEYQRPFVGFFQFEVDFSNETYNEFIGLYTSPAFQIAEIRQGGAVQAYLIVEAGAGVNGRLNKKALAYRVNDFAASLNGAAPIVDTSGSVPIGLTTMRIGAFLGGSQFCNGWISRIAYYPTRLSDATLRAITS